jgi:pentatricopeptide repeat protein
MGPPDLNEEQAKDMAALARTLSRTHNPTQQRALAVSGEKLFSEWHDLRKPLKAQKFLIPLSTWHDTLQVLGGSADGAKVKTYMRAMDEYKLPESVWKYTPLLQAYGRQENVPDMLEVLAKMQNVGLKVPMHCYQDVLRVLALPHVARCGRVVCVCMSVY